MDNINLLPEDLRSGPDPSEEKAPGAAETKYSDPPVERPALAALSQRPPKVSLWRRIFGVKKSKPAPKPVIPASSSEGKPAAPKPAVPAYSSNPAYPVKTNGNNGIGQDVDVDLVADKILFFSLDELYYRLKVGGVILLGVLVVLVGIFIAVVRVESTWQVNERNLTSEITQLQADLANFEKGKNEVAVLDQRLAGLKNLLDRHLFWSRLFVLLEQNTLNDVYYDNLSVDESGTVVLSAVAKNYLSLAQQIAVWQKQASVKEVDFSQAVLEAAKNQAKLPAGQEKNQLNVVRFELTLKLDSQFLTK